MNIQNRAIIRNLNEIYDELVELGAEEKLLEKLNVIIELLKFQLMFHH